MDNFAATFLSLEAPHLELKERCVGFLYLCFKEALNLIGGGNSTREKPFILDAFYPTHIFSSPEDACLRKLQSSRISLLLPQVQAKGLRFQIEFRLPRKDGCITSEMEEPSWYP